MQFSAYCLSGGPLNKCSKTARMWLVCVALIAFMLVPPFATHAQSSGQNLIADGDFEASNWRAQNGIGELVVAPRWTAWYVDTNRVPSYVKKPSNCDSSDPACYWMRPEFNSVRVDAFPNRVHSGAQAQKYFSYGRMHEAGLYQQVIGVQPGTLLNFSIYMQAWQCSKPDACGQGGSHSDAPANMHLRVGIDPYGSTDPFSGNIVWSPEQPAFDQWVRFSVQAQAKGGSVTVFTHSRAEWDWARTNNDVYLDDASLTVVDQGTVQPGTALTATLSSGSPEPTATPAGTSTPRPDGSIVHTVGPADTLYGLSLQYGVPYDELVRLNHLSATSILTLGQQLLIRASTSTIISPTASVAPATLTTFPATPTAAPTLAAAPAFTHPPVPAVPAQPTLPAQSRSNVGSSLLILIGIAIPLAALATLLALRRRR